VLLPALDHHLTSQGSPRAVRFRAARRQSIAAADAGKQSNAVETLSARPRLWQARARQ
jgi:hypothetical protein